MHRHPLSVLTATALLVATGAPAVAQPAHRDADVDRDRAAAGRALDRGGRLRLMGTIGAGMSFAAMLMSDEQMASGGGTALAVGGMATLGLGLIGDLARYRGESRLDALDRAAAGGLDGPARDEAERALRQGRRLKLVGDIGSAMVLALPFFPAGHRCGFGSESEECSPAANAYIAGSITAVVVGIVGHFKTGRAEGRLEAFDETPRASHGLGVAPLRDGVAANYSVAW